MHRYADRRAGRLSRQRSTTRILYRMGGSAARHPHQRASRIPQPILYGFRPYPVTRTRRGEVTPRRPGVYDARTHRSPPMPRPTGRWSRSSSTPESDTPTTSLRNKPPPRSERYRSATMRSSTVTSWSPQPNARASRTSRAASCRGSSPMRWPNSRRFRTARWWWTPGTPDCSSSNTSPRQPWPTPSPRRIPADIRAAYLAAAHRS